MIIVGREQPFVDQDACGQGLVTIDVVAGDERAAEYPPPPDERGLDETTLTQVPGWLPGAYPELFERQQLRHRLDFYDMYVQLALQARHPALTYATPQDRIARLLLAITISIGSSGKWSSRPYRSS